MYFRKITPREKIPHIVDEIHCFLRQSRFVADVTQTSTSIKIVGVKLRHKKEYCGNHGGPCVRPHTGPHRKYFYLEGADWVEFNDSLNDICDRLGVSANITSSVCVIRRGECRRVEYEIKNGEPGQEWLREGHTENWIGRVAPDSTFPEGTPGVYKTNYFCVG